MDEQRKRKLEKQIFYISLVPILCAFCYILYTAFVKKTIGTDYYVVLFFCLGIYWVLTDIVTVVVTKAFENRTPEQIKAYKIYSVLNLAGLAGLGYFAFSISSNSGIYGAMIYVLTLMWKRKYLDQYRGIKKEDTETPESEEAVQQSDETGKELENRELEAEKEQQSGGSMQSMESREQEAEEGTDQQA